MSDDIPMKSTYIKLSLFAFFVSTIVTGSFSKLFVDNNFPLVLYVYWVAFCSYYMTLLFVSFSISWYTSKNRDVFFEPLKGRGLQQ